MPTVPVTVPVARRQVATAPLPSVRVPVDAPRGAFSPVDIGPAAGILSDAIERDQQKLDIAANMEKDNLLADAHDSIEAQAKSAHGTAALDAVPAARDAWQKAVDEIGANLPARQRAAFYARASQYGQALHRSLQLHAHTETEQYADDQFKAGISKRMDSAAGHFDDPVVRDQSIAELGAIVRDRGRVMGQPQEMTDQQVATMTSNAHVAVLGRMFAAQNDLVASAYYDAHKDQIVGKDATAAANAVHEGNRRGESQRQFDAITAAGGTVGDMITKARAISDPEVRDLTETRIRQNDAAQREQARNQREQVMQSATNIIEKTHDFSQVPASIVAGMTVGERRSLRDYAESIAGGGTVKTDIPRWLTLRAAAANPSTRDWFMTQWNPVEDMNRMSPADLKGLVEFRDGLRGKDERTTESLDNLNYRHGIVTNSLRGIGMLVDPKTGIVEKKEAATLYRSVDAQIEALQEREKRKATSKEVQQITDELITSRVVADPHWYNSGATTTKRLFELDKTPDSIVLDVKDIPTDQRAAMTRQLRAAGMPVTDASLVQHYKAYLGSLVQHGPR